MNKSGRIVGMIVFLVGIAVLLFVLITAYQMFSAPASDLFQTGSGTASSPTAVGLGSSIAVVLVKIGLLFVMTLAGSLLAGKGIQLYIGSGENASRGKTD